MNRRQWLTLVGAGILGGCRGRKPGSPGRLVRAATVAGMYSAPVHLAEDLGYFAQTGINVEIHELSEDSQIVPLLANGAVDVALASLSPGFVNAIAKGSRLRIVAGRQIASATCGSVGTLYGRRSVFPDGLSNLAQLKGKRVAVTSLTSFTALCLDTFLATADLSVKDVDLLTLRPSESSAALVAGKLDAAVISQFEYDLEARSPAIIKGMGMSAIVPDFQVSFVLFNSALLDRDPQTGIRFLTAYLRGTADFMEGQTPRFLDEYGRKSGLDLAKISNGCHNWFAKDGVIDLASVQRWIDWMFDRSFVSQRMEASQLVDSRFLNAVRSAEGATHGG